MSNVFVPWMVAIMKAGSMGFEGVSIPLLGLGLSTCCFHLIRSILAQDVRIDGRLRFKLG